MQVKKASAMKTSTETCRQTGHQGGCAGMGRQTDMDRDTQAHQEAQKQGTWAAGDERSATFHWTTSVPFSLCPPVTLPFREELFLARQALRAELGYRYDQTSRTLGHVTDGLPV